jgi:hypothetical protein
MFIAGGVVQCADCDYNVECKNAYITAKRHHEKTGHEVHTEVYYCEIFDRRTNNPSRQGVQ